MNSFIFMNFLRAGTESKHEEQNGKKKKRWADL